MMRMAYQISWTVLDEEEKEGVRSFTSQHLFFSREAAEQSVERTAKNPWYVAADIQEVRLSRA